MTPQTKENLYEIATQNAEELYEQFGAEGLWATKENLPSDPSDFTQREYEEVFGRERAADVLRSDVLSEAELHALREHHLAEIFSAMPMQMIYPPTVLLKSRTLKAIPESR
jgi:hypothetical protein